MTRAAISEATLAELDRRGAAAVQALKPWPALEELPTGGKATPEAFPFEGLGTLLGEAAQAIAEGVQAPDALAGGSVLAAAALAAQAHFDVTMPHGQRAPLSVFVITGGLSGDRKSATDAIANAPAEDHRREQARAYADAGLAHAKRKASRGKSDAEPAAPVSRSLTVSKGAVEGLHWLLRNQPHLGLFTAEGGELLGGHSLREERRSAGLAWLLKAWSGETLDTLTRGDGLSVLIGRRVCLHAMVQPVLLRSLMADPLAAGQGLLARCLIAEPKTLAGTRLFKAGRPAEAPAVARYHDALRGMLERPPRVCLRGDGNELEPQALAFSSRAAALWVEFYNEVERQQAPGQALQHACAFASKAAEHAARIAAIVEAMTRPGASEIGEDATAGAVQIVGFYIGEHLRLTGASLENSRTNQLRMLSEWLAGQRQPVASASLLQYAPRALRSLKAEGLRSLLDELAQRGYVRPAGRAWEVRP